MGEGKLKKRNVLFLIVVGIFGPIFALAGENSTKNISTMEHLRMPIVHQQEKINKTPRGASSLRLRPASHSSRMVYYQIGIASWYGPKFIGHKTACGDIYTGEMLTIAHRTLPCNSKVRVRDLKTGKSIIVKVTDRGPYIPGRIADLSPAAAKALGMKGLAKVVIERI